MLLNYLVVRILEIFLSKCYFRTTILLKWKLAKCWLHLVISYMFWGPNNCVIVVKVFHKD